MKKLAIIIMILLSIVLVTFFALKQFKIPQENNIKDNSKTSFSLMENESIDFLKKNLLDVEVIKYLGNPEEKSKANIWGADGLEHQTWSYKTKGIELDMVRDEGNQVINMITIYSPCIYKTKRNIGIGNTKDDVISAYKNEIDPSEISDNCIIAGSIYGGVIFTFEKKCVSSIYIGAAAE